MSPPRKVLDPQRWLRRDTCKETARSDARLSAAHMLTGKVSINSELGAEGLWTSIFFNELSQNCCTFWNTSCINWWYTLLELYGITMFCTSFSIKYREPPGTPRKTDEFFFGSYFWDKGLSALPHCATDNMPHQGHVAHCWTGDPVDRMEPQGTKQNTGRVIFPNFSHFMIYDGVEWWTTDNIYKFSPTFYDVQPCFNFISHDVEWSIPVDWEQ